MPTHHIIVTGKVQGVFYRATAKKIAMSLDLSGWVKNTDEGDVEMMVSGSEKKLQEFEQWCKSGPSQAEVERIILKEIPYKAFTSFKILK